MSSCAVSSRPSPPAVTIPDRLLFSQPEHPEVTGKAGLRHIASRRFPARQISHRTAAPGAGPSRRIIRDQKLSPIELRGSISPLRRTAHEIIGFRLVTRYVPSAHQKQRILEHGRRSPRLCPCWYQKAAPLASRGIPSPRSSFQPQASGCGITASARGRAFSNAS